MPKILRITNQHTLPDEEGEKMQKGNMVFFEEKIKSQIKKWFDQKIKKPSDHYKDKMIYVYQLDMTKEESVRFLEEKVKMYQFKRFCFFWILLLLSGVFVFNLVIFWIPYFIKGGRL